MQFDGVRIIFAIECLCRRNFFLPLRSIMLERMGKSYTASS